MQMTLSMYAACTRNDFKAMHVTLWLSFAEQKGTEKRLQKVGGTSILSTKQNSNAIYCTYRYIKGRTFLQFCAQFALEFF